jgi:hypothetical protein
MGVLWDLTRGAVAGAAGTWVMDMVTTGMVDQQSKASAEAEAAARPNGQSSVDNLVDLLASRFGIAVPEAQRPALTQALHYGLGVVPGAAYAVLRKRLPMAGALNGLLYGALLFALNDEWANTALGLSGPPRAYPVDSHLRGLVGHLALGVTTDATLAVLPG